MQLRLGCPFARSMRLSPGTSWWLAVAPPVWGWRWRRSCAVCGFCWWSGATLPVAPHRVRPSLCMGACAIWLKGIGPWCARPCASDRPCWTWRLIWPSPWRFVCLCKTHGRGCACPWVCICTSGWPDGAAWGLCGTWTVALRQSNCRLAYRHLAGPCNTGTGSSRTHGLRWLWPARHRRKALTCATTPSWWACSAALACGGPVCRTR